MRGSEREGSKGRGENGRGGRENGGNKREREGGGGGGGRRYGGIVRDGGDKGLGHTLADGLHCGTVVECMMPETETVEQR